MSLHRCTETDCPFIGQTTTKACRCHRTDEQVLQGRVDTLETVLLDALSAANELGLSSAYFPREAIEQALAVRVPA